MADSPRPRLDAVEALRQAAARSGQSQQDLIRRAVDRYLGLTAGEPTRTDMERLLGTSAVLPARTPFREAPELIELPAGVTSADLLDREERV